MLLTMAGATFMITTQLVNFYRFNLIVAECRRKTKELVNDKCSKMESKRKKLQRSQAKEKTQALELTQTHSDLQQLTKVTTFSLQCINM